MSCTIHLPNYPNQRYTEGSFITGSVLCTIPVKMKIRGVFVKLKGKERNEWSGTYGDDEQSNSFSSIKFLRTELPLRGEGTVDVGSFECPFSFQLPLYIPDSFEGPYGGIRYTVDAKVDIPFAPDYTDKKEIIVFNPVDLNSVVYQEYWGSATYSKTKTPFSWCCNGGGITMDVYLAKRAFVPGEKVQVKVHVYNQSNAAVNMVIARISRTIKSIVLSPSKRHHYSSEVVASGAVPGVKARDEKTYNIDLLIPRDTQVPNLQVAKLFKEQTMLTVKAHFVCRSDMEINTVIMLGHIPVGNPHHQNETQFLPP